MKITLTLVFALACCSLQAQEKAAPLSKAPEVVETPAPEPVEIADEPAQYPGGMLGLVRFLNSNLVYPKDALEKGIQGKCYVRFIVSEKGNISEVKVLRGVPDCPECDAEAVRVVSAMPNWTPAKSNGVAVRSYYNLPVSYKLNSDSKEPEQKQ